MRSVGTIGWCVSRANAPTHLKEVCSDVRVFRPSTMRTISEMSWRGARRRRHTPTLLIVEVRKTHISRGLITLLSRHHIHVNWPLLECLSTWRYCIVVEEGSGNIAWWWWSQNEDTYRFSLHVYCVYVYNWFKWVVRRSECRLGSRNAGTMEMSEIDMLPPPPNLQALSPISPPISPCARQKI